MCVKINSFVGMENNETYRHTTFINAYYLKSYHLFFQNQFRLIHGTIELL